jgi:hypothetical protein
VVRDGRGQGQIDRHSWGCSMSYGVSPVACPSRDDGSPRGENAGLRITLRDVPMLPAPANVEDLLARLDAGDLPASSGPFAAMVSDARAVDVEPVRSDQAQEERGQERFFAPVSLAANTNTPRPESSIGSRPFPSLLQVVRAGFIVGALLVCSTALLTPDEGPPPPAPAAAEIAEATAGIAAPSNPELQGDADERPPQAAEPEQVVASDGMLGSARMDLPEPASEFQPEPEPESGQLSEPLPEATLDDEPLPEIESPTDSIQALADAPGPPIRPRALERVAFAGLWAVRAKACTPAMQRRGYLLVDINAQRARAGGTTCSFHKTKKRGNTWDITAVCSNGRKAWKSNVRLTLERGKLTWTSQRGPASYVRCHGA